MVKGHPRKRSPIKTMNGFLRLTPFFLLMVVQGFLSPQLVVAGCIGLKGEALQKCVHKELKATQSEWILTSEGSLKEEGRVEEGRPEEGRPEESYFENFFDEKGIAHRLSSKAAAHSPCSFLSQDGMYRVFRTEMDRNRNQLWKEIHCEKGIFGKTQKEFFWNEGPNGETLVLLKDSSGRVLRRDYFRDGKRLRKSDLSVRQ